MKITLQKPYSNDYKTGYVRKNRENRRTLYLVPKGDTRIRNSTAYARYVLAVKLGRYLTKDEQADHIDDDKTNDDPNNLQILSRAENLRKGRSTTMVGKTCPICNKYFEKRKGNETKTCSRKCGGTLGVRG